MLLALAIVSFFFGDKISAVIIAAMAVLSVGLIVSFKNIKPPITPPSYRKW